MEKPEIWAKVVETFGGCVTTSGWIRRNCLVCEEVTGKADLKQSMGLNTATGGFNCFKCGTKGHLPEHLLDEIPYAAVTETVIEKPHVEVLEQFYPLYEGEWASAEWLEPARQYVRNRGSKRPEGGLPESVGREAFLGAVVTGRLAHRIIVPILDYAQPDPWDMYSWLGWVSRDYTGEALRPYLYPRNMDRSALLYNEPALYVATEEPVYVVEGTLDVLALWPDAVAVLGKPLESQITKLLSASRPVVIALDGDAWEEGWMLALRLKFEGARAGSVKFAPKVDPDEVARPRLDAAARRCLETMECVPV